MHWKTRIYQSAYKIANEFKSNPDVVGIAIGGSIARGMTWKHSDLELCLIVENPIKEFQYFNFIDGLGVEIIQILRPKISDFLDTFQEPNTAMLNFPIQIYKCKIIHDPTAILSKFKNIFDTYLFDPNITSSRKKQWLNNVDKRIGIARELLDKGYYKTSLGHIRISMNELLLAFYWHHNILPRSQNRTEYFLRKNSKVIGQDILYKIFMKVFCLDKSHKYMKKSLQKAKSDIDKVAEFWGSNAKEFLEKACDGSLEWGYPKSITYVYKYCMHKLQCKELIPENVYDNESYKSEFENLYEFLDLNAINQETVISILNEFEDVRKMI